MKKETLRDVTIAGVIILIVVFTGFYFSSIFRVYSEPNIVNKDGSVQIEMTDSKYPGLQLETQTADTKNYLYAIHSLKTDSSDLTNVIQAWINETKKRFIEAAIKDVSHDRVATYISIWKPLRYRTLFIMLFFQSMK